MGESGQGGFPLFLGSIGPFLGSGGSGQGGDERVQGRSGLFRGPKEFMVPKNGIAVEDLVRVARSHEGQRLATIGDNAYFTVEVRSGKKGEYPVFTPESSGEVRPSTNRRRLEEVCAIFNRTSSLTIPDYKETGSQNLSYLLRLVELAARGDKGPISETVRTTVPE